MISQLTSLLQEATTSATPVAEQSTTSSTKGLLAIGAGIAVNWCYGCWSWAKVSLLLKAVEAVGRNPEAESKIRLMLIIGAGIAETTAIYALLIAFLILFV
ncbi:F0F1 ATP synthase subunit C [Mycoplasmopsis cynos]|uniref:F0F1 ATP synthase subunit C n=1 Tax=Mycoplasmopsis cynos TaxID=171284 RepID=UPI0024C7331B|nr:F0F1 ATP synthase subunit C [Mycoplasmopsis cynos]WAM04531.1 F0F1 ATP synthase subunit C [Mycoplasmopsis cynos]